MNDQGNLVRPSYGADQNRKQERAFELLNMIHKTSPTSGYSTRRSHESSHNFELPVLFNTGELDFNKDHSLLFGGRYVIMVDRVFPLKVTKRFIKPQFTSDGYFRPNLELILKKLFGVLDLSNILLLITSTATARRQSKEHILHGFEIETQLHLGVTVLTATEKELIESEHSPNSYSLIFCSGYVELEDVFIKTPIRDQIFHVLRQKPSKAICAWNGDCRIILHYRCCNPKPRKIIISSCSPKLEALASGQFTPSSVISGESPESKTVESTLYLNPQRQSGGEVISDTKKGTRRKRKSGLATKVKESPLRLRTLEARDKISKKKSIKDNFAEEISQKIGEDVGKLHKQLDKLLGKQVDKRLDKQIDKWIDKRIDKQQDKQLKIPVQKKRKAHKNHIRKTHLVPSANIDPAQRKILQEQLHKERLLQRERKWNRFYNSNSKRRDILMNNRP